MIDYIMKNDCTVLEEQRRNERLNYQILRRIALNITASRCQDSSVMI